MSHCMVGYLYQKWLLVEDIEHWSDMIISVTWYDGIFVSEMIMGAGDNTVGRHDN